MIRRNRLYPIALVAALSLLAGQAQSQTLARSDDNYSNFASGSLMAMPEFKFLAHSPSPTNPFARRSPTAPSLKLTAAAMAAFPNITGTGTPGNIPYFSAGTVIRDSMIFQSKQGNIGIGTTAPGSKLTVEGMIETTLGGLKFPDGTVQTTAGVSSIFHDATLVGDGTAGMPLGVAVPLSLTGSSSDTILVVTNNDTGAHGVGVRGEGITGIEGVGKAETNSGVGTGMLGRGGDGQDSIGGTGVSVLGGNSQNSKGGTGMSTLGGASGDDDGGAGVTTRGGDGNGAGNRGGDGIRATRGFGINGAAEGRAGFFLGDVEIDGALSATTKMFRIDHPLDPENKYLNYTSIESPDMMNVYNGNVTTDLNGEAVVTLPDYFQALNKDFRYQLTVIGQFAQAIVSEEIHDNRFTIRTDNPTVKVSWQVTGIRKDPWAEKNRIKVEEEKSERERGFYLHPDLFDMPEEKGIEWAHNPELMKRMKEKRQKNNDR